MMTRGRSGEPKPDIVPQKKYQEAPSPVSPCHFPKLQARLRPAFTWPHPIASRQFDCMTMLILLIGTASGLREKEFLMREKFDDQTNREVHPSLSIRPQRRCRLHRLSAPSWRQRLADVFDLDDPARELRLSPTSATGRSVPRAVSPRARGLRRAGSDAPSLHAVCPCRVRLPKG